MPPRSSAGLKLDSVESPVVLIDRVDRSIHQDRSIRAIFLIDYPT